MTHSLHRQGDPADLARDFVVFAIAAQGITSAGSASKFREFACVVKKYDPVNWGDMRTGNIFAVEAGIITDSTQDNSIFHAVFTDADTVASVLRDLAEADLGLSIVVSGLFDTISTCCEKAGLSEHTVEYSLGIWGRTDLLPDPAVQKLSTMCGHGMVSFNLIEHCAREIAAGRLTAEKAAGVLSRQCHCGIFNPVRAVDLLESHANRIKT